MKKLYELKNILCEKLEEYSGKEVTTSTLEIMESLSTTIKNIEKILAMNEEQEYSGYSKRYHNAYNAYDDPYGSSYARYQKRDSMGRYARDGYSRDDMSVMVEEMRNLANSLPANQRGDMDRLIHKMENM